MKFAIEISPDGAFCGPCRFRLLNECPASPFVRFGCVLFSQPLHDGDMNAGEKVFRCFACLSEGPIA